MKKYNLEPVERVIAGTTLHCIVLGEPGRGRRETLVPVDFPLGESVSVILPKPGSPGRARIVNTEQDKDGWVARIRTESGYRRGAHGHVSALPESGITTIAKGQGAFGLAGNTGSWDDVILKIPENAWIQVTNTLGERSIMLFSCDEVHCLTEEEAATVGVGIDLTELQTL